MHFMVYLFYNIKITLFFRISKQHREAIGLPLGVSDKTIQIKSKKNLIHKITHFEIVKMCADGPHNPRPWFF